MSEDEVLTMVCFVAEMDKRGDKFLCSHDERFLINCGLIAFFWGKTIQKIYEECFG